MSTSWKDRALAALGSVAIPLGLVCALVIGLAPPSWQAQPAASLVAFADQPPVPPRRVAPPAQRRPVARVAGGGGGPARAPSVTPLPAFTIAPAEPAVIVPLAMAMATAGAGVADVGESGSGDGTGGGTGSGQGAGAGAASGLVDHARQTHGHLSPRDVPDGVLAPGGSAAVAVRYVVGTDGRVRDCTVTGPSGLARIDAVPCPLIARRFRFRSARDAGGQPVSETIEETHTWFEPAKR